MRADNIITKDDWRFECLEGASNGYPEVHIPVMGDVSADAIMSDVAPHPGLFDCPKIEVWRKVYINHRPAWKRVDTHEESE